MTRMLFLAALCAVALVGCAVVPDNAGPTQPALRGAGISDTQYQHDDGQCRQTAENKVGMTPAAAMKESQARTAALMIGGTVLGAITGGILGGTAGSAVVGAAIGTAAAAPGAIAGGAYSGAASYQTVQQRYNGEYWACMDSRGHRTPVSRM